MRFHRFYEIPDLPIDAFKHVGDRRIRPQGGSGGIPVVSDVVNAVSNVGQGAANAITGGGGGGGGLFGGLIDTVSSIGQGAVDTINSAANTVSTQVIEPVVKAVDNTVKGIEQDPLGSAAKIATAIVAPEYLPAVVAADAVANGAPIDKALEQAATAYVAQNVGSNVSNYVNNAVDSTAAANTYGTDVGSQQSNMLAQQESGFGTPNDVTGNIAGTVAGGTAAGIIRGQDPLVALTNSGISAGTTAITDQIPGFSDLSPSAKAAVNSVVAATLMGGNPSQALVNSAINTGIAEARNQVNAPAAATPPGGTQVASTDGGLPTVSMSGSPIYAESSSANTVTAPFGFDLMPASLSDNRPAGAYYDQFQNAWFMPNQDTQNLQTQLQNQTPAGGLDTIAPTVSNTTTDNTLPPSPILTPQQTTNGPLTTQVGSSGNINGTSTAAPSTLDTVAQTNQAALDAAKKTNNPDLVNAVNSNNTAVIAALAAGNVAAATNLIGGTSNAPGASAVNQNQIAGADQMGTSGTSGVQLDYTPHFVKGSQISLVGAPTFETSYISPQQMQMQAPSPYTPGMQGYAEGSSVGMQPQFTHGRPQFLQGLMTPVMRPQVGHMQFQRHSDGHSVGALGNSAFPQPDIHPYEPHSEGHSVEGEEHVPEFYSEGGLKSMDHTYVTGDGDGTSDSIPAMLANGEFVIPADVVASLGNGSNESGASVLDQFMKVIREHKRDAHPDHLPPDSKGPLAYLQEAKKKV